MKIRILAVILFSCLFFSPAFSQTNKYDKGIAISANLWIRILEDQKRLLFTLDEIRNADLLILRRGNVLVLLNSIYKNAWQNDKIINNLKRGIRGKESVHQKFSKEIRMYRKNQFIIYKHLKRIRLLDGCSPIMAELDIRYKQYCDSMQKKTKIKY